jgi:diguanylate cyclase (GGDEF)-like protein
MAGLTIGVLSTSFGGRYFGGVMGGIARATAAGGGRLVAIQTLDSGTAHKDLHDPPDFADPVAWDHISAFVIILNAVNADYLRALERAGKPFIMISEDLHGYPCPVVLPDNLGGVREAVRHLLGHGHRRIAFAGHPAQRDLLERYQGYQEELRAHGIEPDPSLFFDTGDNQFSGGRRAARAMIEAGLPSTAVVAGNDLNAIGLMEALQAGGFELPRDQAVIGFDDMAGAAYLNPSLSSVRQSLEGIGAYAVQLVLAHLAGQELPAGYVRVPTSLVTRESCGCPDTLSLGKVDGGGMPIEELAARLWVPLAGETPELGIDAAVLSRAVSVVDDSVAAAARGDAPLDVATVRDAMIGLYAQQPDPERLIEIMRCVRAYGTGVAASLSTSDPEAAGRVHHRVHELVHALGQAQARSQFYAGDHSQSTLYTQYMVSMNLLRSHERDPRTLDWVAGTQARGGCLGLWWSPDADADADTCRTAPDPLAGDTDGARLRITSIFDREHGQSPIPVAPVSVRRFPPAEVLRLADLTADDVVYVSPMRVDGRDRGMLSIVGPLEAAVLTGREMVNQWSALLTIALGHEAVVKSLRTQEERLRHDALYDRLTGLANRTLFLERLGEAMRRSRRRPDYRFAVLLLDLDRFKVINDSLGHRAGDRLLVQVAGRILQNMRDTDVAARFGGDEFAVLLDDIGDTGSPDAVAKRLHAALDEPFALDTDEVVVSSSIGIALGDTGYESPEDMVRDADTAMYSSKSSGTGSHVVFTTPMHAKAVDRLRTETDLRRALDQGEMEAHYQPIVRLSPEYTAGFESLIRWRHPTRGLVGPGEFLPIAEDTGLIIPIGRWILQESCRQLREWQISGAADETIHMSVNVSNRQFWHGRLIEDVWDCLRTTGLRPQQLVLEITEGVIMHDVKTARHMLADLRELGVRLHIDDFGTGYSSLEALQHLSIDALKIDRSFVTPLGTDSRSGELARTIILMGANLGLSVVAEGIETPSQRDYLREAGCTYGQGYWFSRPVPAAEAELLIRLPAAVP